MTDPATRERAALDVLELLPDRWALGPTSYDPGIGRWSYTVRGPHPGRGKMPETITGTGLDELAMIDLAIHLDERRKAEKLAEIDRRGRGIPFGSQGAVAGGRGPAADGRRGGTGFEAGIQEAEGLSVSETGLS